MPAALLREYGGDVYGGGLYGGGLSRPFPRAWVNFDRNPLALGGVITGDNATLASLGDWAAGDNTTLDWTDAAAVAYAGSGCARLTADADGDISATLTGQGPITAGRTYLVWVHTRPEDEARTARLTLDWSSATDVALTTVTAERAQSSTGYVRLGAVATAPPGAGKLAVTVTVLDADADEIHYLDTVSCDDVGTEITDDLLSGSCTLAGRNHELDRTDAGQLTLTLGNEKGWYTPGAETDIDGDPIPAPYLGNIVPRRRVWVCAEHAGVLYAVWSGHIRRWEASYPGGLAGASEVKLSAVDGFRFLSGVALPAPYRAQVLTDGPLSLFPLDEPSSAAYAGSLVFGEPARLLSSPTGDGKSAFGADSVLPTLLTGRNSDGGSTSLGLNLEQDDLADMGSVLDLRFAQGMPPQIDLAPWALEFWFAYGGPVSPPGFDEIMFRHLVSLPGADLVSGFQIELSAAGAVHLLTGNGESVATSPVGKSDGAAHHVVVTYSDDGSTWGLASLYVDGDLVDAVQLAADPMPWGLPSNCQLGGAYATTNAAVTALAACRFQHVAFYYLDVDADLVAAHWEAGAAGYYRESDGDRVETQLRLGGWPDEDTAIDAGLTPLLPRDWSDTNVLALVQDTSDYAGASVVMDATGKIRGLNRWRFVNRVVVVADFRASEDTEAEASDFAPSIDETTVENVVEVAQIGGGTRQVSDAASVLRYGPIKGDTVALGAANDDESLTHAEWLLSRTAEPRVRVDTGTWLPPTSDALWPLILDLQFGDRVRLHELPATAPVDPLDVLIGRVSHSWPSGGEWQTGLQLEPAVIDEMGVYDDDEYGTYDDDLMVLGY